MTRPPPDRAPVQSARSGRAKVAANRANAQKSTGPTSSAGKTISARNALIHGLAVAVWADPRCSEQIEKLSYQIAGEGAEPSRLALARRIAEAQVDLIRVRAARFRLLAQDIDDPEYRSERMLSQALKLSSTLLQSIWDEPVDDNDDAPFLEIKELLGPLGAPDRAAAVIGDLAKKLARLDRYEARALSRRKMAIREFDAGRFGPS